MDGQFLTFCVAAIARDKPLPPPTSREPLEAIPHDAKHQRQSEQYFLVSCGAPIPTAHDASRDFGGRAEIDAVVRGALPVDGGRLSHGTIPSCR